MDRVTLEQVIHLAENLSLADRMRLMVWLQATITPKESALKHLDRSGSERKTYATQSGEFSITRLRDELRKASPEWQQQVDNLIDHSTFSADTH